MKDKIEKTELCYLNRILLRGKETFPEKRFTLTFESTEMEGYDAFAFIPIISDTRGIVKISSPHLFACEDVSQALEMDIMVYLHNMRDYLTQLLLELKERKVTLQFEVIKAKTLNENGKVENES